MPDSDTETVGNNVDKIEDNRGALASILEDDVYYGNIKLIRESNFANIITSKDMDVDIIR